MRPPETMSDDEILARIDEATMCWNCLETRISFMDGLEILLKTSGSKISVKESVLESMNIIVARINLYAKILEDRKKEE